MSLGRCCSTATRHAAAPPSTRPGTTRSARGALSEIARKAKINNPADLTARKPSTVVDFLVARKKAGQFRTLESSFEEQVQLLSNREVDIINCWEPAVREANKSSGRMPSCYAYTVEGYYKWGHGAYIASQAKSRGNLDNIYKVLNYFMDGEYRAYQARDRGYAGPNMDLGVDYAETHGWSADRSRH